MSICTKDTEVPQGVMEDWGTHGWEVQSAAASFLYSTAFSVTRLCPSQSLCLSVPHFKFFKEKSPCFSLERHQSLDAVILPRVQSWLLHYSCVQVTILIKRGRAVSPDRSFSALNCWVRWYKKRGLADKVNILKLKARYSQTKEHHSHSPFMLE